MKTTPEMEFVRRFRLYTKIGDVARAGMGKSLLVAAKSGSSLKLAQLLEDGTDPNYADEQGNTALMLAKNGDCAGILLFGRADPKIVNAEGQTALIAQVLKANLGVLNVLRNYMSEEARKEALPVALTAAEGLADPAIANKVKNWLSLHFVPNPTDGQKTHKKGSKPSNGACPSRVYSVSSAAGRNRGYDPFGL